MRPEPSWLGSAREERISDVVTGESSRREMIMRWAQRLLSAGALSAALVFTGMSGTAVANGLPSEGFADLAAVDKETLRADDSTDAAKTRPPRTP